MMCQVRCKYPILLCTARVANPLLEVGRVISGSYGWRLTGVCNHIGADSKNDGGKKYLTTVMKACMVMTAMTANERGGECEDYSVSESAD